MELLEDNHRVELRVYQQKVKHLEYEHRNNIKSIIQEGTSLLEGEQGTHEDRERELLRVKEQLKFDQMELELVNANKVSEVRQQHEKQLAKLRQQFEDSMTELTSRCEARLKSLENDLELRRKVEIHEVEERKNQHINDLIKNHKKAFSQMKSYYNEITSSNLKLIKSLQNQVEELKERANQNKKLLYEYILENQKLSEPLQKVSNEITELQTLLKERTKDQMALRNANSRLSSITKSSSSIRSKLKGLEEEYATMERERDALYTGFEESIQRVKAQTEFQNQALEQRLLAAESNVEKAALQVEEIIRAANLDNNEVARMMSSLHQTLTAKDEVIKDLKFQVVKLQKGYNDSLEAFVSKLKELGIPMEELNEISFKLEQLPIGSTTAPVPSLVAKV
jgi:myosin heavy subunit